MIPQAVDVDGSLRVSGTADDWSVHWAPVSAYRRSVYYRVTLHWSKLSSLHRVRQPRLFTLVPQTFCSPPKTGAEPEGPKSEARIRAQKRGVLGERMFPSHQLGISSPVGSRAKSRRPDNLERFLGLQAAPGVDFADVTFISVKFSRGQSHIRPHNQILLVFGPRTPTG